MQNVRIQIRPFHNLPAPLGNSVALLTMPDADGNIAMTNLPEALFFVAGILGLPADGYVSEMRQGSRSIMDDGIVTVGKTMPDPLEVVISRGGGTIAGTVQDAQHRPVIGARVFLIPDLPRRGNLLLYKTPASSTMGAFSITGVAPGAYKIFAWDVMPPQGAEQNSEFLSRYDALGTPVIVNTGAPATNIQVSLIPANR
ncbi:MAG TPA: carboxypeptidase-like regulatory domain-containing protein [Verrucomicrobiaceae bacterium]